MRAPEPPRDFTIPLAPGPASRPGEARAGETRAGETRATEAPSPFGALRPAPTGLEVAAGAGILCVLLGAFLIVRLAVKNHLRDRRATLDAANAAAWTLFAALALTALVAVSATVGAAWDRWLLTGPAFVLCAVVFGMFLVLFVRAPSRTR
ncbi:hypothetical protein [Methylobacterium sp. A54F]